MEEEGTMLINVTDDAENWKKWGLLVQDWALGTQDLPKDAYTMQQQINDRGIVATVPGWDDKLPRPVYFYQYQDYPGTGQAPVPLQLPLPSPKMLQDAQAALSVPQPYPLSWFYGIAFGGASKATLNPDVLLDFQLRRLGEYVILQCQ
jgi:hypothetical protein